MGLNFLLFSYLWMFSASCNHLKMPHIVSRQVDVRDGQSVGTSLAALHVGQGPGFFCPSTLAFLLAFVLQFVVLCLRDDCSVSRYYINIWRRKKGVESEPLTLLIKGKQKHFQKPSTDFCLFPIGHKSLTWLLMVTEEARKVDIYFSQFLRGCGQRRKV